MRNLHNQKMKFKASYLIKKGSKKTRSSKKNCIIICLSKGEAVRHSHQLSIHYLSTRLHIIVTQTINIIEIDVRRRICAWKHNKWLNKKKKRHKVDHWWRWWWDTHNLYNKYNLNYLKYIFQIMKIVRDTIEYTRVCIVHKNVQS